MKKTLLLIGLIAALSVSAQVQAASLSEGFDSGMPADWVLTNNSNQLGINGDWQAGWHQSEAGATEGFGPYSGTNYACARDASCVSADSAEGNIDTWMMTPVLSFNAGDTVSFYAKALGSAKDSLEVRLSIEGASTNCGTQALDLAGAQADFPAFLANVGDFSNMLGAVNPWHADGTNDNLFPTDWTQYVVTINETGSGRIGFRYLVPDGGYNGANSWVIGVDDVQITPEPATMSLLVLGGLAMLRRKA